MGNKKMGLIAGDGHLPLEIAKNATMDGYGVIVVDITGSGSERLNDFSSVIRTISPGQLDSIIGFFSENGVDEVVLAGKVDKAELFKGAPLDNRFLSLLQRQVSNGDDALLRGIAHEFETSGLNISDQRRYLKSALPPVGLLTDRGLTDVEEQDILYGFNIAKKIGGLDIGQTVVVGKRTVLAVEAIEGTDECLIRGGSLGKGISSAVKVAKPNQDMRFDVPTVGLTTVLSMIKAKVTALAIEAGNTFLLEKDAVLDMANEVGLAIISMNDPSTHGDDSK